MPKDAPPNGGAPPEDEPFIGPRRRVSEMQAKLHRPAAADPGRKFDDLSNFVHDPATLIVAFDRVAGNTGSRTPGVDGLTVADVEEVIGGEHMTRSPRFTSSAPTVTAGCWMLISRRALTPSTTRP